MAEKSISSKLLKMNEMAFFVLNANNSTFFLLSRVPKLLYYYYSTDIISAVMGRDKLPLTLCCLILEDKGLVFFKIDGIILCKHKRGAYFTS
jgi:hypothetical protein